MFDLMKQLYLIAEEVTGIELDSYKKINVAILLYFFNILLKRHILVPLHCCANLDLDPVYVLYTEVQLPQKYFVFV